MRCQHKSSGDCELRLLMAPVILASVRLMDPKVLVTDTQTIVWKGSDEFTGNISWSDLMALKPCAMCPQSARVSASTLQERIGCNKTH